MGDWIVRTHWAVAADEGAALEVYERLEEIAAMIRREGSRLDVVERALLFAKPTEWHDNIRDTKVRALLALGRADEAYAIVREVLARAPDFQTFADLAASPEYRAWCERAAAAR